MCQQAQKVTGILKYVHTWRSGSLIDTNLTRTKQPTAMGGNKGDRKKPAPPPEVTFEDEQRYPSTRASTSVQSQLNDLDAKIRAQAQKQEEMINEYAKKQEAQNKNQARVIREGQAEFMREIEEMLMLRIGDLQGKESTTRTVTAEIHQEATNEEDDINYVDEETPGQHDRGQLYKDGPATKMSDQYKAKKIEMPKLPGPEEATLGQFKDWKDDLEDYSRVQRLMRECDQGARQAIVMSTLETGWKRLIRTGTLKVDKKDDIHDMTRKIGAYLREHRNPILDRIAFSRRYQREHEQVDSYYAALKELDDNAGYGLGSNCGDCNQERIRDRLIVGLFDASIQAAVLKVPYSQLTLERTLEVCRAEEASKMTQDQIKGAEVNRIGSYGRNKLEYKKSRDCDEHGRDYSTGQGRDRARQESNRQCQRCGAYHGGNMRCWAEGRTCFRCGEVGHLANMCDNQSDEEGPKRNNQVATILSVQASGFRPRGECIRPIRSNTRPRMSKAGRDARTILREIAAEEKTEHAKQEPAWEAWESEEEYRQKVSDWRKKGENILQVSHDEDEIGDQDRETGNRENEEKHGWTVVRRGRSRITQL